MGSVPNGFAPSSIAHLPDYDSEAQLVETRPFDPNHDEESALADRKAIYQTQAQDPSSITPFLKAAKYRDEQRRNYRVLPGGKIEYDDAPDRGLSTLHSFNAPSRQESLGHNSLDGTKFGGH